MSSSPATRSPASRPPAALFSSLRSKAKNGILIEGVAVALVVFIGFMLVSFALDRTLRLESVYRIGLFVALILGIIRVLTRHMFRPIRLELTDDELALAVERGEDLHQSLISAVQFERVIEKGAEAADSAESVELMQHVVTDVYGRVDALREKSALDVGRVRKFATIVFGCVAVVGTWAAIDSDSLVLWAKRNLLMSDEDWPRHSFLEFAVDAEEGVVRVPEGNDLTIEVIATGVIPDQVFLDYEYPDGTNGREAMALSGGGESDSKRFTWLLEAVISNVSLSAYGGDAKRQHVEIELVKRPVIQDLLITRTYPEYMKLDPEPIHASEGDVRLPAGVHLTIRGTSTKQIQAANLTFGQDEQHDLTVDAGKSGFEGSFRPTKSGVLTIDVTDRDGLGAHKPPKLFMRVVKDISPVVDYKTTGIGSMILFKALIPANLKIRDDFGLTKIVGSVRVLGGNPDQKPGAEKDKPFEVVKFDGLRDLSTEENELEYEERVTYDLQNVNDVKLAPDDPKNKIRPGMLLQILFEATDNFGPGEPNVGKSEVLTLRIVTEDKLMQDLHRRQIERRQELTHILDKEKSYKDEIEEIVSPTAEDSRAKLAGLRLRAIARDQHALTKQVSGVADRYRQILDEYFNNRLLQPTQINKQRQVIQNPLERISKENFPTSAEEVTEFALGGLKDQRDVAVASYNEIIKILEDVISNMRHLESVAGILEEVRVIRNMEQGVERDSKSKLRELDKGTKKPDKKDDGKGKGKKEGK